jgi:hypothetical protein
MQCQACDIPLQIIRSQDLELHYCRRCGAIYEVIGGESRGGVPRRGGTQQAAPLALGKPSGVPRDRAWSGLEQVSPPGRGGQAGGHLAATTLAEAVAIVAPA